MYFTSTVSFCQAYRKLIAPKPLSGMIRIQKKLARHLDFRLWADALLSYGYQGFGTPLALIGLPSSQ
ncbi:hypothetical protein BN873_330098 [Candidatus Competibacter denitrificans Run_A_D11]|uniref:Uncharacterized protein n=1 Tax=Candidatus Competibacter denitrificans Run_A_D11 TaxID=1400863 RepID=W6M481_9GAMM|nr:hypothetical protein BN873_330098 [Candidatus Competibacter denitrificans Run_A_D11]